MKNVRLLMSIALIYITLSGCSSQGATPMLEQPEMNSLRDDVIQIKPDSLVLMKGRPPIPFEGKWIFIVTFTPDYPGALIEVRPTESDDGQRYEVQAGDTIPIGGADYQILAIEEVDHRLAWVEIDSTPQR